MSGGDEITRESLMRDVRARHPGFREAVLADAAVTAEFRGERYGFTSGADAIGQILRLMWTSDAFAAQVFYRARARLQALGIPIVPRLLHWLSLLTAQVTIGDPVVIAPGLYLLHGQVVIDGLTEVGARARIAPFVTIGLRQGDIRGPRIAGDVEIGTGAKVLGSITVGEGVTIGANSVVITDVDDDATVVGAPAKPLALAT